LALGTYSVRVTVDNQKDAERALKVVRAVIDSAVVTQVAGENRTRSFVLRLSGAGFSKGAQAEENVLIFQRHLRIVPCLSASSGGTSLSCVRVQASDDGRSLTYSGIPDSYAGTDQVSVQIGSGGDLTNSVAVTLPTVSYAEIVNAVGVFLTVV